jgi:hypothetical protein
MWASSAWGTAKRITAAMRGALCGIPLKASTPASEAAKQELLAAALLISAGNMLAAVVTLSKGKQVQGRGLALQ